MSKAYKVLPNSGTSFKFTVKCGEYVRLSGYGICPGVCVKIDQIHEDKCRCIYDRKPFCLFGEQLGMDHKCSEVIIPMPGCYSAYLCVDEDVDYDEDFAVHMSRCTDLENLQTVLMAAGIK